MWTAVRFSAKAGRKREEEGRFEAIIYLRSDDQDRLQAFGVTLTNGSSAIYKFTTGNIGDLKFVNAKMLSSHGELSRKPEKGGYYPLLYRYQLEDSVILVFLCSEEGAKIVHEAIESAVIAGTASKKRCSGPIKPLRFSFKVVRERHDQSRPIHRVRA